MYLHVGLLPSNAPYTRYATLPGSYAAVAIDTLTGCSTNSDSLVFGSYPYDTLMATIYAPHLLLCTGDSTTLVAGGYSGATSTSFQWFRNGTAISGATGSSYVATLAGSYRVAIDAGLCNADTSATAVVAVVAPPTAFITASAGTICAGDTTTLQATTGTGYSYTWQRNGTTIPGAVSAAYKATSGGSYTVTISNGACVAVASVNIVVNQPPAVSISPSGTQPVCAGRSLTLSTPANAGWSYTWTRNGTVLPGANSNSYTASVSGSYQVVVSTAQCPSVASDPVTIQVLPVGVNLGPDTTNCWQPGAFLIPLSVDTGFKQILWSTGALTPSILASDAGTYWVSAINQCGSFTDTMRIYDYSEFLSALPDDTVICNAAGAGRLRVPRLLKDIRWSTGETTPDIAIKAPGTYWVEGQSPCGPVHDTIAVGFCRPLIDSISLSDDSICEGSCISIRAFIRNFPATYSWSFSGGSPSGSGLAVPGTVCYGKAGAYPVTLVAGNIGGADTAIAYLTVAAKPVPRFKDTAITVSYKSLLRMPACADAAHVDWFLGDSLICAGCPELHLEARYYRSVYRCVVRNGSCPDSCSYALRVVDIPNDLWLPDAFTPNGDGRNDIFRIITDNPNIQVIDLDVYNRWGQRVFISNMNNGGWDGTLHGQPAAAGSYFWQLRYKVLGGKDEVYYRKGDVVLIR